MRLTLSAAVTDDAPALLDLHLAASRQLTAQYGVGPWSGGITVKGVLFTMRRATIYAVRDAQAIVGTFALSQRKPWAIDTSYFSACKRPLYLTSMAVRPEHQRRGVGTFCIGEARRLAKEWPPTRSAWMPGTPRRVRASSTVNAVSARWAEKRIEPRR